MLSVDPGSQIYKIRPATLQDLQFLPPIETSAATLFRSDPNLTCLADDEPIGVSQHQEYLQRWQATDMRLGETNGTWVATLPEDGNDTGSEMIVGFIVTIPLPAKGDAKAHFVHVQELSVHADHQRKGLASRLLMAVQAFAGVTTGIVGLSLTTFRDVPFNAPFYAKFGFVDIRVDDVEDVLGADGIGIWEEEQEHFARVGDGSLGKRRCWMMAMLSG